MHAEQCDEVAEDVQGAVPGLAEAGGSQEKILNRRQDEAGTCGRQHVPAFFSKFRSAALPQASGLNGLSGGRIRAALRISVTIFIYRAIFVATVQSPPVCPSKAYRISFNYKSELGTVQRDCPASLSYGGSAWEWRQLLATALRRVGSETVRLPNTRRLHTHLVNLE